MDGRYLTLLYNYSPVSMLHNMHAREVLSFAGLFHPQHEAGDDSAQNDGENDQSGQHYYTRRLLA